MRAKGVLVTSADAAKVTVDDYVEVPVLGAAQDVAMQLDEVIADIWETVASSITTESELVVELTGTVSFKGSAEARWLVFNVGGSGERVNTLKVALKTSLKPSDSTRLKSDKPGIK